MYVLKLFNLYIIEEGNLNEFEEVFKNNSLYLNLFFIFLHFFFSFTYPLYIYFKRMLELELILASKYHQPYNIYVLILITLVVWNFPPFWSHMILQFTIWPIWTDFSFSSVILLFFTSFKVVDDVKIIIFKSKTKYIKLLLHRKAID